MGTAAFDQLLADELAVIPNGADKTTGIQIGAEHTFTIDSTMAHPFPTIQPRTFHRISDAAKENALSRMLVGIHFPRACEAGLTQGIDVGTWIVKHESLVKGH